MTWKECWLCLLYVLVTVAGIIALLSFHAEATDSYSFTLPNGDQITKTIRVRVGIFDR